MSHATFPDQGSPALISPGAPGSAPRHPVVGAVRAEWTKLRTMPSTPWLLLGIVAATVAISAGYAGSVSTSHCPPPTECFADTTKISLTGVSLGQLLVAILALLAITNEYSTRMIGVTLTAIPGRLTVLLTKAGVVTATVLAAGALGVAGSVLAGRLILPGNGFTAANGYPLMSLADGPTLRAAVGSVLYLGLVGLLSLGVGVVIRDTAGAITTLLALLYLPPFVVGVISDPQWLERLHLFAPTIAGQAVQATVGLDRLSIGPWAGLGVLAGWAGAALLLGALVFTARDA